MNGQKHLHYFVLICNQKSTAKFVALLTEQGGRGIDTVYGRGSANAGLLARMFGFETEERKAVLSCLLTEEAAARTVDVLCNEHHFHQSGTGIAFSIPVEGLAF